eukprot:CAMPEP_0201633268 /NCGR_PEP_ID=MMETSP0493-20130528/6634_1 /ASSEMBLY_ACC=CAM_ASM_000838 /TAXON_ID=420259 /ORGANISM="Thalassiosira gravida, Strain GMp14c1" /LENGTH=493 /DNA_ID=CAMNT_0048104947 /DNA_START=88 /DNA_END=1569 /DNA_ORIENTATION=+
MSQASFKKRLKVLMLRPENQVCSDCPERQPRWASLIKPPPGAPPGSLPMGAFACLECSGSHRRLGVHIAFVRSVNLDQWKETEVAAMENGGNAKINAIFEPRLTVNKPTTSASGTVRERFIRDKYERRKFYDPSAFERVSRQMESAEQEKVVSGVQRRLASSGSRKPSDAARKRVEERAARKGGGGHGGSARSVRSAKAPAPAPPPAPPVDLLDFGDFESAAATTAVQASVSVVTSSRGGATAAPAPVASEPQLDLFANMATGNNPSGGEANGQMQQQPGQPQQQLEEQKKMSTADIMSMFNNPSAQHNPTQQNMFAMNGGMQNGMAGGMGGGNNMAMMGQQQMGQQQMGQQQMGGGMNANNNMAMMNNMNPQQQQMAMMNNMQMMQRKNMMGQQQGMGNMGGNNMSNMGMMGGQGMGNMGNMGGGNGMMMQQQGQMPQMNNTMAANNNMMMMQGGGGMMQGGNQYGQSPMGGQAQQPPQKQQQFAEFGNFGR